MGPTFCVNYYGTAEGCSASPDFACPRAAVAWALKRGLRTFVVNRVQGPKGFYSAFVCYNGGRLVNSLAFARPWRGRGRGYGPAVRRVA